MRYILIILLILSSVLIYCSTSAEPDDVELVKQYRPNDKYFKSALVSLHFVIEVTDIPKIDESFQQIIDGYSLPISAQGCPDGTYSGTSPYDAFDYMHTATITIKDEKIVSVDYDEVHRDGHGKRDNDQYNEEMKAGGGTPPNKSYPVYEQELLDTQNIMEVDGVTGASYSNYRFRYAVILALMKAHLARNSSE